MIRGIEFYIFVWVLVAGVITCFRHLSGKERWAIAKVMLHSAIYASIALLIVIGIVILF